VRRGAVTYRLDQARPSLLLTIISRATQQYSISLWVHATYVMVGRQAARSRPCGRVHAT